jgi:metal-responsive CopG/Arc/MetJ family transcriptional regulator
MSTEKPKIIFVADEKLIERLDDFRFGNRVNSRSEAIRILLEKGLTEYESRGKKQSHK